MPNLARLMQEGVVTAVILHDDEEEHIFAEQSLSDEDNEQVEERLRNLGYL